MVTEAKLWTEAHRREALRRTYEIAAELADPEQPANGGPWMAEMAIANVFDESIWRTLLRGSCVPAARIDREVRRVRALAEGRLVRKVTWHVRMIAGNLSCAMEEASARDLWRHAYTTSGIVVRVTRIRRVP